MSLFEKILRIMKKCSEFLIRSKYGGSDYEYVCCYGRIRNHVERNGWNLCRNFADHAAGMAYGKDQPIGFHYFLHNKFKSLIMQA